MLAARGFTVCAADVRGIGDLAPAFSAGAPSYARSHQDDESYAWSSLILGRPLVGQRVKQTYARALSAGHTGIRGDEGWNASKWGNVFRIGAKERYESYNNAP